jgi:hypothetical protein
VPGELGVYSRSWWVELARQPCRIVKAVESCGRKMFPR